MTPQPPSSPDGSPLPPRHRPMLGDLAKDTTEMDLWAFEDDLGDIDEPSGAESGRSQGTGNIPAPREVIPAEKAKSAKKKSPEEGEERIRMNVNKPRLSGRPAGAFSGHEKPESDFDDLEAWDDAPTEPVIEELPSDDTPVSAVPVEIERGSKETEAVPAPATEPQAAAPEADEFAPALKPDAKPVSLRPHLNLSRIERIGLVSLLVVLLGGSIGFLTTTVFRLPQPAVRLQARDFPIKGEKVRVDSADCYWRTPITEGEHADVCRRGTLLLPVIEMTTSGGTSMLRVFFKNDDGATVGDPILRKVSGGTVKIAATAGIEDAGIFAAYRTGNQSRWTAHVYEIPSGDVATGESRSLFEIDIPAVRR